MTPLARLLSPGRIGRLELKNRLVMAPMGTFSNEGTGVPLQGTIDHYVERARGGVGLIIVEATMPMREIHSPHHLRLYDDAYIPDFQKLTQAVHEHGSKISLQLAGMGVLLSAWLDEYDDPEERAQIQVFAPSAIPWSRTGFTPKAATREDIAHLVEGFSEAARRAKDAGFDAVEFHGAHGLLMTSFLSPRSNKRTDEYGGSLENRCRFVCEVVQRTRQKVGPDFPISLRISGSDYLPGGMGIEEVKRQAKLFVAAGADVLSVSASVWETSQWQFIPYLFPDAPIVHLAQAIKSVVDVPVIGVGKIGDPRLAERILEQGQADFVAMGRALLSDPHLLAKAIEGRYDDIVNCIYCNNCLEVVMATLRSGHKDRLMGRVIACTVNPALLRDREFTLRPAEKRKKVMVIGGGLAGMEAAAVLAERGHRVAVYEKEPELGGQWNIACLEPEKRSFSRVTQRIKARLDRAGARVVLGTRVTPQLVAEERPDAVVISAGASPASLDVPGAGGKNVVQAVDVIQGKATVGQRVVVLGGRHLGMETAAFLAQQGKQVSLVTRGKLGGQRPVERSLYFAMRDRLLEHGVYIYTFSPVEEVREDGVYINVNGEELLFLPADIVVMAVGAQPEATLADELRGLAPEVHVIGDAKDPRNALYAINEGAEVGRVI